MKKQLKSLGFMAMPRKKIIERVVEFMSYDIDCENEKQRRAIVKMYLSLFNSQAFDWNRGKKK